MVRLTAWSTNCTFERNPWPGHTDIEGLRAIKRGLSPRQMIATHISHRNLGYRALRKTLAASGILLAWDGMKVTFRNRIA